MDEIKLSIKSENYDNAYRQCEDLLEKDNNKYGNSYILLSFLAMASMKVEGKEERAIFALERTLTLADTPVDQHQKIWKHLSQLYETKGLYSKVANSNTQLYNMMKDKRNTERMIVLAEIIIENYIKATGMYHIACEFIANHVLLLGSTYHIHCIKMISFLYHFYTLFIDEQKGNGNSTLSLGSASTAASDEQKRETQSIVDGYDKYDSDKVTQLLVECLKINDNKNEINENIIKFLLRYLMNKRLRSLSMHYNGQASTSQWKDIFLLGINLVSLVGCKEETLDIIDVIIEAWIYTPEEPYDTIASIVEEVLLLCPTYPTANIAKSLKYIEEGLVLACVSNVNHCMNYWNNNKPALLTSRNDSISDLSYNIKSSITSWCLFVSMITNAFIRYRDVSLHDLQYYSQEMKSRFTTISRYFSVNMRNVITYMIPLAKVMSYSVVGFGKDAFLEESSHLPRVFSASISQLDDSYFLEFSELPIAVQWLSIIVLYSLGLYHEVNMITNSLLASPSTNSTSWIIAEQSYSKLLQLIFDYKAEKKSYGESIPAISFLYRDMTLNEAEMTKLIKALQSAIKTGDKFCNSIEAEVRFRIGLCLWLAGGKLRNDPSGSIASFLLSAKLDPNAGHVYTFIGHYYHLEKNDKERAIKCYIKALGSNSLEEEAGLALSQIYLSDEQEEKAIKLWDDICDLSSNCSWCFALRGKYYLCKDDCTTAVTWYQRAVELNPDDDSSWHGLGLSYSNLQQNTAAYKAILKAFQLAPNDIFINIALAEMERKMCMPIDSNKRYDRLLKLAPLNELVLQGAASCCLVLAYHNYSIGWTLGAAISIVNGIKHIETLIKLFESKSMGNKFESVWKLLGDLSSFASNVLTDLAFVKNNDISSFSIFKTPSHISGLGSCDLLGDNKDLLVTFLKRGESAYRKVIEIQEKNGNIDSESFYDLGMNIYAQVNTTLTLKGQGSILLSKLDLLDPAISAKVNEAKTCFIKGIRLNPNCGNCFNGLGITIVDDDVIRQACFVKAIQSNNNTSALLNLGLLFLRHNLESSARSCFSSLQLIESNPQTWIGFGQLYEMKSFRSGGVVDDELNMMSLVAKNLISAQDAYYAALEVSKPTDALFGAAVTWLKLHKYLDVDGLHLNSHTTPNTFEAIQIRYEVEMKMACCVHRNPINPLAWIILAWSLEIRGAFKDAADVNKNGILVLNIIAANAAKKVEKLTDKTIESLNLAAIALISSLKRCCVNGGINTDAYLREHQIPGSLQNLTNFVKISDIINNSGNIKKNDDYDSIVEGIINSFNSSKFSMIATSIEEAFQYCSIGSQTSSFASLIRTIASLVHETKDTNLKEFVCLNFSSSLSYLCASPDNVLWNSMILCKSWVLAFFVECSNDKEIKMKGIELGLRQFPCCALLWIMKAEETDDLNEICCYADKAIEITNEILRSSVVEKSVGSGLGKSLTDIQLENDCPWLSIEDLISCATAFKCINNIAKGTYDSSSKSAILRCLRLDPSNDSMWLLLARQTFSDVLTSSSDDTKEYGHLKLVSIIALKLDDNEIKSAITRNLELLSSSSGSEFQYFKDNIDAHNSWYYLGCIYANKKYMKCSEYCFIQANLDNNDFHNILLSLLYYNNNNDMSRSYAEKCQCAAAKVIEASIWLNMSKKNKAVKVLTDAIKEWKCVSMIFPNLLTIVDEASSNISNE